MLNPYAKKKNFPTYVALNDYAKVFRIVICMLGLENNVEHLDALYF